MAKIIDISFQHKIYDSKPEASQRAFQLVLLFCWKMFTCLVENGKLPLLAIFHRWRFEWKTKEYLRFTWVPIYMNQIQLITDKRSVVLKTIAYVIASDASAICSLRIFINSCICSTRSHFLSNIWSNHLLPLCIALQLHFLHLELFASLPQVTNYVSTNFTINLTHSIARQRWDWAFHFVLGMRFNIFNSINTCHE